MSWLSKVLSTVDVIVEKGADNARQGKTGLAVKVFAERGRAVLEEQRREKRDEPPPRRPESRGR